jgi:hypothetical protein
MAKELRDKAHKLIDDRYAADADRAGLLNRLLDKKPRI